MSKWWEREGLCARYGRLQIAGRDAERLAREYGTPLFVYDLTHAAGQLTGLQGAFARAGLPHRVRLALKALRSPEFLAVVRSLGVPGAPHAVGIDACSPQEVEHALAHGFEPGEISVTGTNLSDADLTRILRHGVHVNPDLITQVHRVGRIRPGHRIGLRINPRCGHVNARTDDSITLYSSERPTKFGIYEEDLPEAVSVAARYGLIIDTAHFHVFNGILNEDLPAVEAALPQIARHVERLLDLGCPITEINVGGGLGVACHEGERPLDLDAWAGLLKEHLGGFDAVVSCEPGEYVSLQAGVLLAEVVTVEDRLGHLFAGLDVGWNVMNHHFVYRLNMELVHTTRADAGTACPVTFSGNINEGPDLFATDLPFPPVEEGDIVAMLSSGAYSLTMYHPHCLRPPANDVFFSDRLPVPEPADPAVSHAGSASA